MATSSLRSSAVVDQANPDDRCAPARSTDVDLVTLIRQAIHDAGWNQEALASHMGHDKAYISRVLSGEKPLNARFVSALPDDVEKLVVRRYAEHFGFVVVAPLEGEAAVAALVGGLVGLLTLGGAALPRCASSMAKATLPKGPR
jgi:hypothetical protein